MGLDFYELHLELEEDFEIKLADSPALPVEHVGELFDVLLAAIREQHPDRFAANPNYQQHAWAKYVDILVNQLGLNPKHVVRSAHFVDDLKCN
jgi:acyl carrier protein